SFLETEITAAADGGVAVVVMQVNSRDAVIGDDGLEALVETSETSPAPTTVWVGPSGSKAQGEAVRLLAAAQANAQAHGSRIEGTAELAEGIDLDGKTAIGEKIGAERAVELGLVDSDAPVLGEFLVDLPGVKTELVDDRREPSTTVRFGQLDLIDQLF